MSYPYTAPDDFITLDRNRHQLEQRKVAVQLALSRDAQMELDEDFLGNKLLARMTSYVLAEQLVGDTKTIHCTKGYEFPSSPWQFYKQRHASSWWLGWLVARRPVRTEKHYQDREHEVRFERYATYPESTLRAPELGRPVIMESYT